MPEDQNQIIENTDTSSLPATGEFDQSMATSAVNSASDSPGPPAADQTTNNVDPTAPNTGGNNLQTNKLEEETEESLKKNTSKLNLSISKMLKLYIVPLIIISVFGAIVFTLILPSINNIFNRLSELNQYEDNIAAEEAKIAELQQLEANLTTIRANLAAIELVIPEQVTQVTNFQQKIRRQAEDQFGLKVTEAKTGEIILSSAVESADNPTAEALAIIEIPSNFSMNGTLPQIRNFINSLEQTSDFLIIGEMELSAQENYNEASFAELQSGLWKLDLSLIKYQFPVPDSGNNLFEVYSQTLPSFRPDPEVIEFIQNKVNAINAAN